MTFQWQSRPSLRHSTRTSPIMLMTFLLSVLFHTQVLAETARFDDQAVGEVSLVLGKAFLHAQGRVQEKIEVGTRIYVNDQIQTQANGHVHIRFVDDALVSIRPDSRLEIVHYDYQPDQPQNTSIKLNLEEGITRSISGDGARSARERFRLNTPIAAIGVRGTDFVVSASRNSVRALVNEGIIVLAPFSSDCTVDAFGPCLTNAIELSDASLQIIEMDGIDAAPRLLPAPHERDPEMMRDEVQMAIADVTKAAEDKTAGTGVYLENVSSRRMEAEAVSVVTPPANPNPIVTETPPVTPAPIVPPVTPTAPPLTPTLPVAPPVVVDYTPVEPIIVNDLTKRQLVWGRWATGQGEQERMTLDYLSAKADREISVGNKDYMLFRSEPNGQSVQKGLGPISFALNSAQAFYHSESGVVAMAVNGGSLDINFNDNSFSTNLKLSHSATGNIDFNAAGRVFDSGYFHTKSATERLAGAVSTDGKEAGYFFEIQLANGGIQGLTLWDKR